MNQEDPRSDLWTFLVGSPKPHPAIIPLEYQRLTPHLSKKKKYPTPDKHPRSQKKKNPHLSNIRDLKKKPYTCQTFVISKKYSTPVKHSWSQKKIHLTNIRDLKKKYPTPNKHPRSQKKKNPHLSNIRDLKKNPTPVKHSWSQKNTPHLSNIRDLKKKYTSQTSAIHGKKKKYPTPNKHSWSKFIFTWKIHT